MLRKIVTLLSIGLIAGASAENSVKLDQIQKSLDKIIAKAGISFDGEVKSQFLSSQISGDGANDTTNRQHESNEFTAVDFDIKARPNEMISGRVMFRMHQNWQNFFADVANPIFTRWISIDGNVKDMIGFHIGDLRDKYSPLTLYTPEIEILNEPYIFARQRQIAMDELFVGNNDRVLQGVNFKVDAEIAPIFNEFHFGLIGSRLRNIETSLQNGNKVTPLLDTAVMAKYFVGANLDLTFFKGINLGGTYLFIFDQKNSFRPGKKDSIFTKDTMAQRTSVISLRPGINITKMLDVDAISFKLSTEFAFSNDDSTRFDSVGYNESTKKVIKGLISTPIKGSAINVGGEVGISPSDMWGIKFNGSFISNSKDYRNDLAQSPSFIGDRIMNVENNVDSSGMYNTFDALDHYVFKFTPASEGPSNRWVKSPFSKNSYGRSIYTQAELARMQADGYFDPAVQLVMPLGPATPNRVGINAKLSANVLNEGIVLNGLFASLKEAKGNEVDSFTLPKAEFSQVGVGLKLDFSKFIPVIKYPFELSGSLVASSEKIPEFNSIPESKIQSNFLNLGLYYKFFKRAALLGGIQVIENTVTGDSTDLKITMSNWAAGFEWRVSDGADVVATYGQMAVNNPEVTVEEVTKNPDNRQDVIDLSLRIRF